MVYTGTLFATYLNLADKAKDVIKAYHADFYVHDAKVIAAMEPGDVALWKPRESGSCLIIVARGLRVNERAKEAWEAFSGQFGKDGWWQISSYNSIAHSWSVVEAEDAARTIAIYAEATADRDRLTIRAGGQPPIVSEIHM